MPIESTSGERHRHRLIRRVLCVRGTVDMQLECEPSFDYGRAEHTLELGDRGALFRSAALSLSLSSPVPLEQVGHGRVAPASRSRPARASRSCSSASARARRSAASCAPARRRRSSQRPSTLAPLARAVDVPRPLARDGRALGADAQAADLHADRRDRARRRRRACPRRSAAPRNWDYRYTWIRDAAFTLYALPAPRLHRRGGRLHGLARAAHQGAPAPSGRHRAAADHVRHRRPGAPAGVRAARTSTATAARSPCASATARRTSSSSTSTAS